MVMWTVCVTALILSLHDGENAAESLKRAKAEWSKYAAAASNMQGSYRFRTIDNDVPSSTAEFHEVRRNSSCHLVVSYSGDCGPDGACKLWRPQRVRGNNSRYVFELKPGLQGWALADLERHTDPPPLSPRWPLLLSLGRRCSLGNLPEVVEHPRVQLVSLEPAPGLGSAYYAMKCILERDGRTVRATIVLDSTNYWCVSRADFEESIQAAVVLRGHVTNRFRVVDGLPHPSERETEFSAFLSGKQSKHIWKEEFDYTIPRTLPGDGEFTLSAFGLPEPFGVEWERPTPWWLYAGIAAGALLLVIFLLGIWKRRLLARG